MEGSRLGVWSCCIAFTYSHLGLDELHAMLREAEIPVRK